MQPSDTQLLRQYAEDGSECAFRELVERHTELVFSICYAKLHDVQLAEDAAQQVFLGLAAQAKTLKPGPLEGYLARIAFRVTGEMWRARMSREKREREFVTNKKLLEYPTLPDPRVDKVQEVLSRLTSTYRDAISLRYMQGMSVPAIAVALDVSQLTVRKRLVRALVRLREMMEEQGIGMTLSLAAGMLGRIERSTPPADLASRIANNVLSAKPVPAAPICVPKWKLFLPRVAVGIGSAATVGTVVAISAMPRMMATPTAPPAATVVPSLGSGSPSTQNAVPLTFRQKLGRRVPDIFAEPTHLDFALSLLAVDSGVPIRPQWEGIEAAGIKRTTYITATVTNSTIVEQVDAVLKSASPRGGLEYVIDDHEGVIIVRSRDVRRVQRSLTPDDLPAQANLAPAR
jgi:RNA polymerase sigma factor (sigma-70 family)